ncbi:tyrosine-type recombinase/integrase [Candidatus Neomarinimicrobiota bacterium]
MAGMRKLRGLWYVRLRLPGGGEKLLPTRTGDKQQALAFKRRIEEQESLVKARLLETVKWGRMLLRDAVDEYLHDRSSSLKPKTLTTYELALRYLKECWGSIDLSQITPQHLSKIRQFLSARFNPTSTNINLRAIRTFLNWLEETERIERIPGKITLVLVDKALPKFFTPAELECIFAKVKDPKLLAVFRLLAETGLRRSELFKCTLDGNYLHLKQTKGRSERMVAIPPAMIDDFLLATSKPYTLDYITHAFTPAIRAAGINPKGRSLHSLRHTFALREYARTGDIYKVKSLLGHSSVTVTEIYTKFPEQYLAQAFGEREEIVPELDKDSMFSA